MRSGHTQRSDRAVLDPLITEPLHSTIDPVNFTPRLLALLSNALVWRESLQLRRNFELGTNDWRVLSALALRPGISATEVCDFIGVNKAIVSRSVTVLADRDLIALADGPRGSRPMYLTTAGAEMHDAMLPISLQGQDIILSDLDEDEVRVLNGLLQRMIRHIPDLESVEGQRPVAGHRGGIARF